MSEPEGLSEKYYFRVFLLAVVFAAVIYLIVRNISVFGNVLLVLLGFGAVILAHEFGHFIVAKLSGIKVEAFSIGFPPILAGFLRTERGYRIRILPEFFPKKEEPGDGLLSFTIGKKAKASETEYRIGLIPFGGFVKMLGQEDVGSAQASDDPRSYVNKPVIVRMAVITAGVLFNAISAIIIFMVIFLIGINRVPAVVGGVVSGSPAEWAGLRPGDEIIEIAGKSDDLEYYDIAVTAALSGRDEEVALKVRHEDGTIEDYALVAEQRRGDEIKDFGILLPRSLAVGNLSDADANSLLAKTGLLPGDRIESVNGRDVDTYWELAEIVQHTFEPEVTIFAKRKDELIKSRIGLDWPPLEKEAKSESDLSHIYSMVPRLRITTVFGRPVSAKDRLLSLLSKMGRGKSVADTGPALQSGDIILAIGDVENPTYKEMRDVTTEYEDKELPIKVLRADSNGAEDTVTVTVVPTRPEDVNEVLIGLGLLLDAEHPVVAKTIAVEGGPSRLIIPRGAVITAVDGVEVSNFYDIIREISRNAGERITIDYRLSKEIAGAVALNAGADANTVTVKSIFTEFVPFEPLERLYKASGPIDAVRMGYKKTVMFIAQTYITLKRLISGLVSPKSFMGPVGIVTFSYRIIVERPLIDYFYFLGLISSLIAVFNFLPLPPIDGGLIVLLLVEKIKGSALSERTQGIIAYAGWVLIGSFVLYVTFNDIVRNFFQ